MTALWNGETCLAVGKRRPVTALQMMESMDFGIIGSSGTLVTHCHPCPFNRNPAAAISIKIIQLSD